MPLGSSVLSTADVPAVERVGFWTQALGQVCRGLAADGYGAETLDGRIKMASVGALKLCDITASRHRVTSGDEATDVRKSTVKIVYQLGGISVYQQGGKEFRVKPGDCIVYDVSRPHTVINSEANHHIVVAMPKELAMINDIGFGDDPRIVSACRKGLGGLAINFVRSVIKENSFVAPGSEADLTETILRLIRLPLTHGEKWPSMPTAHGSLNRQIKEFIQQNIRDPNFNLDRLAAALGCSKRLMHQSFAREGMTITQYLWASRLEACRRELPQANRGGQTLTQIALSWGFNSSSHFSRTFKTRFGRPPSEFTQSR